MKSQGQIALSEYPGTNAKKAEMAGASKAAFYLWISGEYKPSASVRHRLLEVFNIPMDAWDRYASLAITQPEPTSEAHIVDPVIEDISTMDACLRLIVEIRDIHNDGSYHMMTAAEKSSLKQRELGALRLKAQIEFNNFRARELIIRDHPDWVKSREGMLRLIEPCHTCWARLRAYYREAGLL